MTPAHPRYVAIETLIGSVINGVLSLAFCIVVFGGYTAVPVQGAHGLIVDAVPQTFMVTLMSLAVPVMLTRARRRRADLNPTNGWATGARRHPVVHALKGAVVITAGAFLLHAWLLPLGPKSWPFAPVLVAKTLYGALLGALLTRFAVQREIARV